MERARRRAKRWLRGSTWLVRESYDQGIGDARVNLRVSDWQIRALWMLLASDDMQKE
jgi:hypothetical protein